MTSTTPLGIAQHGAKVQVLPRVLRVAILTEAKPIMFTFIQPTTPKQGFYEAKRIQYSQLTHGFDHYGYFFQPD
jgi:hypothetical protein